jgi:hypothetical protein
MAVKVSPDSQDVVCQFCGEGDFDLIGLKSHYLSGYCPDFEATLDLHALAQGERPRPAAGETE